MGGAKGFALCSTINGIIDSLTGTHLMTKASAIAETADLPQDYVIKPEPNMFTNTRESRSF